MLTRCCNSQQVLAKVSAICWTANFLPYIVKWNTGLFSEDSTVGNTIYVTTNVCLSARFNIFVYFGTEICSETWCVTFLWTRCTDTTKLMGDKNSSDRLYRLRIWRPRSVVFPGASRERSGRHARGDDGRIWQHDDHRWQSPHYRPIIPCLGQVRLALSGHRCGPFLLCRLRHHSDCHLSRFHRLHVICYRACMQTFLWHALMAVSTVNTRANHPSVSTNTSAAADLCRFKRFISTSKTEVIKYK